MSVLMVPGYDPADAWPTLGLQLADWLQEWLVFGPGDVRGEPYRLDQEKVGVLARMYEVHPLPEDVHKRDAALRRFRAGDRYKHGDPLSGRRRFKRTGISVRKGWAKTELLAATTAGELHPDAPVRTIGWTLEGGAYVPVGGGVKDPYIPLVAFTEEQSEELAFGALKVMLEEGPLASDFDISWSGIIVIGKNGKAAGKAVALAAAPNSRDGARTTFQGFDETHRQDSDRLRHAHQTMLQNIPKRLEADAHSAEVTTSFEPGKDSIAERTHRYAEQIFEGKIHEPSLLYYHRSASDHHDLGTRQGRIDAVAEASGPAIIHTDVDYVVGLSYDPDTDLQYWERVWLNREVSASGQYFPMDVVKDRAMEGQLWRPEKGALVTLGFDGSKTRDATGIVGTCFATGRQWVVQLWERPTDKQGRPVEGWEVPTEEVDAILADIFAFYDVVFLYADPYWWETPVAKWIARFSTRRIGKRRVHRVVEWPTNRPRPMALSLRAFRSAMRSDDGWSFNGDPRLVTHLANSRRYDTGLVDDDQKPLETIRKERPDSPDKMDLAMAACLSWEARRDAIALGAGPEGRMLIAH